MPMTRPEDSPMFSPWRDPESGVFSWLLTQRVAPMQHSFYFTNPSFTNDGRFLWFHVAFPPLGDNYLSRHLAVIDFEAGGMGWYPETRFLDASPGVDLNTGEVYWATGLEIWKRGPLPHQRATFINAFPRELAKGRRPLRLATHLTFSADRRSLNIDAQLGRDWFVGDMPLDGSPFRLWQRFDQCYNHGQFSPTDPDVQLIAQDGWTDAATGEPGETQDRLWLIRRDEKARPILPDDPLPSSRRGHEWWDADGRHVWYIDYRAGTERVNIDTGERETIWPAGHTHSHCDRTGQLIVGDINLGGEDSEWRVAFFNRKTGRETSIVSYMPAWPRRREHHIHPHPQFCFGDRYICYTTNVRGVVDLALVNVEELTRATE